MRRTTRAGAPFFLAMAVALTACGGEQGETAEGAMEEEPQEAAAAATEQEAETPQVPENLPEGVTAEMIQEGQQIFTGAGICYTCHGPDATGTPLAPNLTDDEWINVDGSYEAIIDLVMTGVPEPVEHPGPMLPKGGSTISDEQVSAVAAYVWSLSR